MLNDFHLIGFASGMAGVNIHTGDSPAVIKTSPFFQALVQNGYQFVWDEMISSHESMNQACVSLAEHVAELTREHQSYCVVGGDHTAAIGTWSGVYAALHDQGEIGLIWIDAHMDSHTPETTESGRMHGMPLACLLGYGDASYTQILNASAKIKPQNVCLIGVRSFERGEAELLKRLNVRIYFMEEVMQRGFATVLKEAVHQVSAHTVGFGLSIDVDGIDPCEAPGVDVPEPNGIVKKDFLTGIAEIAAHPKLIATEIVEFNPTKDIENKTEKLIVSLLEILHKGAACKK